jgi:hypothetical protein
LLLAGAALLALVAWLWMRMRELERERQKAWLDAARRGPAPVAPSPSKVPLLVERSLRTGGGAAGGAGLAPAHRAEESAWPEPTQALRAGEADAEPVPPTQQTQPLASSRLGRTPEESRDVSAEELIDLEQQAEFFIVLGQDDAAIDLLVAHLRDSGGASPLPYLKLLEIYRRQGDRAAYARTRDRFNVRFNAHAPAWDAPTHDGKMLQDYPQVMLRLQQVWPRPLDAMAELEALLFRRDDGELFDLPAYRELLMLYAVAREETGRSGPDAARPVDVLLPLGSLGSPPRPGQPQAVAPRSGGPTEPVDLDLSDPAPGRGPAGPREGFGSA